MKVIEIFYSLQGEGSEIGLPTIFLRTSGCNLRCEWCDTKYAWEDGEEMELKEIKNELDKYPIKRLCITGGEPLLQEDLMDLLKILKDEYEIIIETNGSIDISPLVERGIKISMDYKTPSSCMDDKMFNGNLELLTRSDILKFVIADEKDYSFSVDVLNNNKIKADIIFQPVAGTEIKEIAEKVIQDGLDVRVLPQLHKIIWGDKRGV